MKLSSIFVFFFLSFISALYAEDCIKILNFGNNLEQNNLQLNEVIQEYNQQGFTLDEIIPVYAWALNGSVSSNKIGPLTVSATKFTSQLDGSMSGQIDGKGQANQVILKFHK